MSPIVAIALGSLANTAEITSNNIRGGSAAFDNLKASWGQALKVGDFSTNLNCKYDYSANRDFISEASLSGDLVEAASNDDVGVSYEVSHDFGSKKTNLKLSAKTQGTTLVANVDDRELTEVSAQREVDISGNNVNVQPSWMVKAKTARVKLMSSLGGGDNFRAQVDYNTQGGETTYEVGYDHSIEDGRDVSATFNPADKNLEVEYTDKTFEKDAAWTVNANVPLDNGANVMDNAKLTLKRAWSW
jgi:hypothetical protein